MDQKKIGSFIAARRKDNNLTQSQLAEMLGITDKAVSKWETGKSMPDPSLFCPLCDLLHISVLSLLQIIDLKRESRNILLLFHMGKNQSDLKYLICTQVLIKSFRDNVKTYAV